MAQNGKNGKKYKSVVNFPVIFGAEMVDFWLKTKKKVDFSGPRPGLRHPFKKTRSRFSFSPRNHPLYFEI